MRELNPGHRALCFDEMKNARQHLNVRILPDPEIVRADRPSPAPRPPRENKRRSADCAAAEMHQMPVRGEAIGAGIRHIGETTMRLRKSTSRICSDENN